MKSSSLNYVNSCKLRSFSSYVNSLKLAVNYVNYVNSCKREVGRFVRTYARYDCSVLHRIMVYSFIVCRIRRKSFHPFADSIDPIDAIAFSHYIKSP